MSIILNNVILYNPKELGTAIFRAVFLYMIFLAIIQYPLGKKIANFLQNKDGSYSSGIIPSWFGWVNFGKIELPVLGLLIGGIIGANYSVVLIASIATIVFSVIFFQKHTTVLRIENGRLFLIKFKRIRTFTTEDIDQVGWKRSSTPYNRSFVITLKSGEILSFAQEDYWGLENTCALLSHDTKD